MRLVPSAASSALSDARDRVSPRLRFLGTRPSKVTLILLGVILAYALPILNLPLITTPDADFGGVLFDVAAYALIAVGLNVVIGYAGLLDLGYVGFYACGAYVVAILTQAHADWPFYASLPVAIVVTMIAGVVIGAPTLRVRGDYLAIVTLGFGEIIRLTANNVGWFGGPSGLANIPSPPNIGSVSSDGTTGGLFSISHLNWDGVVPHVADEKTGVLFFSLVDATPYYWMVLTALIVILWFDIRVKNSRIGRAWEATREDEDVAELMGVPTFRYKLLAFALGASVGGLTGALFATRQGFVSPDSFTIDLSILFVAAVVVGGWGNRWGAMAGGAFIAYLPDRFLGFAEWRIVAFGLVLILLTARRPQGLFPTRRQRRTLRTVAHQHQVEEGIADG